MTYEDRCEAFNKMMERYGAIQDIMLGCGLWMPEECTAWLYETGTSLIEEGEEHGYY